MTTQNKEEIMKIEELLIEAHPPLRVVERYVLQQYLKSIKYKGGT